MSTTARLALAAVCLTSTVILAFFVEGWGWLIPIVLFVVAVVCVATTMRRVEQVAAVDPDLLSAKALAEGSDQPPSKRAHATGSEWQGSAPGRPVGKPMGRVRPEHQQAMRTETSQRIRRDREVYPERYDDDGFLLLAYFYLYDLDVNGFTDSSTGPEDANGFTDEEAPYRYMDDGAEPQHDSDGNERGGDVTSDDETDNDPGYDNAETPEVPDTMPDPTPTYDAPSAPDPTPSYDSGSSSSDYSGGSSYDSGSSGSSYDSGSSSSSDSGGGSFDSGGGY